MKLEIKYLHEDMDPLYRAYPDDAGADVPLWKDTIIKHGKNIIPLGFELVPPRGWAGYLEARSSVMGNGCIVNQVPFDSGYADEWRLVVYNVEDDFLIKKGERICQVVFKQVLIPEFVTDSIPVRGRNGMGSTGK